jgi:hypothetical protein
MIGLWERIVFAIRCSFSILFRSAIPDDIAQKMLKPAAPVQEPPVASAPRFPASRKLNGRPRIRLIVPCRCWRCCNAMGG